MQQELTESQAKNEAMSQVILREFPPRSICGSSQGRSHSRCSLREGSVRTTRSTRDELEAIIEELQVRNASLRERNDLLECHKGLTHLSLFGQTGHGPSPQVAYPTPVSHYEGEGGQGLPPPRGSPGPPCPPLTAEGREVQSPPAKYLPQPSDRLRRQTEVRSQAERVIPRKGGLPLQPGLVPLKSRGSWCNMPRVPNHTWKQLGRQKATIPPCYKTLVGT